MLYRYPSLIVTLSTPRFAAEKDGLGLKGVTNVLSCPVCICHGEGRVIIQTYSVKHSLDSAEIKPA